MLHSSSFFDVILQVPCHNETAADNCGYYFHMKQAVWSKVFPTENKKKQYFIFNMHFSGFRDGQPVY